MAHIYEPRVRQKSDTIGTGDFELGDEFMGSLRFDEVMSTGDTCDYVASYQDSFEEGSATLNAGGDLERTAISRALHANGTIDTNPVSFAAGLKTIIMTFRTDRAAALPALLAGALRFDKSQSLSTGEKRQALDNLGIFPSGTNMLFHQTTPPPGWTKATGHNDKVLRIVSGTVTSGGVHAFTTVFGQTSTGNFTLTTNEMPVHTHGNSLNDPGHNHSYDRTTIPGGTLSGGGADPRPQVASANTGSNTTGVTITNASQGSGAAHAHPMDIRVQYLDMIYATKDN